MKGIFPLDSFQKLRTPFYYYDSKLLRETLNEIKREAGKHEGFTVLSRQMRMLRFLMSYRRQDLELTVSVAVR